MTKIGKYLHLKKNLYIFVYQKLQFTSLYASIKDVQATGEVFIPQKRTSSTSKHEFFFTFLWIRIPIRIRIRIPNADPDPADQNECGSVGMRIHNTDFYPPFAKTKVAKPYPLYTDPDQDICQA
jgi:hypothetical protein